MTSKLITILVLLLSFGLSAQEVNIIPMPVKATHQPGSYNLTSNTKIIFKTSKDSEKELLRLFQQILKESSGLDIAGSTSSEKMDGNILLQLNSPFNHAIGNEGYQLNIKSDRVFLNANTEAGLFYGIQSIWQLLGAKDGKTLPCMDITDYPRFAWRGMHLDVSRHFMPLEFIYKFIDYLAMHKMNVFHWHLVDDQGWRIEIKKYPKLTEVGAWRADREHLPWDARKAPAKENEKKYGGFYSQEEIRSVVAYAQSKQVTIVPEIEMPAHVMSGLAAYPEFSCTGAYEPVPSGGVWPITHIFCAGKDETFHFLEDVLAEVIELFPSTFIHIGGDEATKTEWEKCELCQKRMTDEGLKDEHELQSYFIQRIEEYLNENGRRLIGWDEILEGGLKPSATVMSWRGSKPGTEAAKLGHDVVMSPNSHCYFDYYQGNPSLEPKAWGGNITLKKVYHYEPVPEQLTAEEAMHILGGQANIWTEYMPDGKQVEYMILPRMTALSEVLWTPVDLKNWGNFSKRMEVQYQRFEKLGVNYASSAFQVNASPELDAATKTVNVSLSTEAWEPEIRYTTDGSDPDASSLKYSAPFVIKDTRTVKAVVVKEGQAMTRPLATQFFIHKAVACPVSLKNNHSKYYPSTGEFALVNGIKGSKNHGDKKWLGFNGENLIATLDLGEIKSFSTVKVGFIQNAGAWIFYPTELLVEVSSDGINFKKMGTDKNNVSPMSSERQIQELMAKKKTSARFVRVTAKNLGTCPKGHAGEGKPAWLFVDEIIVE